MKIVRAQNPAEPVSTPRSITAEQIVERIIELGRDKKALNIVAMDLRDISALTDFFVIMSGTSDAQVRAIAGAVREALREENVRTIGSEGSVAGHWLVLDFDDVIVHVFHNETREYYDLDGLWADAPRLSG